MAFMNCMQRIGSAINSRSDRDRRSDHDLIADHFLGLFSDRDLIADHLQISQITFLITFYYISEKNEELLENKLLFYIFLKVMHLIW